MRVSFSLFAWSVTEQTDWPTIFVVHSISQAGFFVIPCFNQHVLFVTVPNVWSLSSISLSIACNSSEYFLNESDIT